METYVVLRRNGWRSEDELRSVLERSLVESRRWPDNLGWIRSYALEERDGSVGSLCVFAARSPEAIRRNAAAAGLPVDEIVTVAGTLVVLPDPLSSAAQPWREAALSVRSQDP